jgi:heavy metal translocating P-type ATPase
MCQGKLSLKITCLLIAAIGLLGTVSTLDLMKNSIPTTFAQPFAKIIHLVEDAEASKAPIQKLSDKLATRLIQFAIRLSVLTFIDTHNVVSTISVIVVAGACGLAVGTPIALLATNGKLSRRGVIVKGGLQIENLSSTGTIIFDKTGTLTSGKPGVSQVVSFDPRIDPIRILEYAAIAEKNVNHPLGKAIVTKAREKQIELTPSNGNNQNISSDNDENIIKVGRGVTVFHDGRRIAVGNMKFMEDEMKLTDSNTGGDTSASLRPGFSLLLNRRQHQYLAKDDGNFGQTLQISGSDYDNDNHELFSSTIAFVSLDRQIIGAVLLEDKLRQETKEVISKIKAMSIHVVMLTGDNESIAERIANEAGIEEYHANLLQEDKVSIIEEMKRKQKEGKRKKEESIIMVGDGINDAPALAKARVGIAMGRSGTDVAIETADVVLMTEDLTKIPYLLKTSKQSLFAIKQNFFGTLFIDGLYLLRLFM